jgi:phosphoglycerate dehydrogenase-like enzyme
MLKLALCDDYQNVALQSAEWQRLAGKVEATSFNEAFGSEDEAAAKLAPFDIVCLMRERLPFPRTLIERLPNLKLIVLTGARAPSLDVAACTARGIPVCHTGPAPTYASTAELGWGLVIATAREMAKAERNMRNGKWHDGLGGGLILVGARLGLVGLGRLGGRAARYGKAFGMDVVAWSQNLTADKAKAEGARLVSKDELMATSDVVSVHLILSQRTRNLIGAADIARMKPTAILVNTSRGPIVDEAALIDALRQRRIAGAGLDVFDHEPLPRDHPFRTLDNVVLTPHLGYVSADVYRVFYADCLEDIEAWLAGKPIRVIDPAALGHR